MTVKPTAPECDCARVAGSLTVAGRRGAGVAPATLSRWLADERSSNCPRGRHGPVRPERSGALSGGLDSDSAAAWSALSIARDQHAGKVPCVDRPEWTSDRPAERAVAAAECAGCPVIAQCAIYAATAKERWNTWAGLDLQIPANRKRLALTVKETTAA